MNDEAAMAQPRLQLSVPPPSRVGNVLGWSLLALGVAGLIATAWAAVIANSAKDAWGAALASPVHSIAAYNAIVAAEAAYRNVTVSAYLLFGAAFLSFLTAPGLVYALSPPLLGGPLGRLLRMASVIAARHHGLQQPVTYYQGLAAAVQGAGAEVFCLVSATTTFDPAVFWFVFPALLLYPAAYFWSFVLLGGSWWFTMNRRDPRAGVGERGIEGVHGDQWMR